MVKLNRLLNPQMIFWGFFLLQKINGGDSLQVQTLTSINKLSKYKVKGCKYDGINEKDGTIYQQSESGEEFNIVRWIEHLYTISLQYLTFAEAEEIINQCLEAKRNRKLITISKDLLEEKGYVDMKTIKSEPLFKIDIKDIKPKQNKRFYEITMKVKERVDYL